jgi:hypothetical protein
MEEGVEREKLRQYLLGMLSSEHGRTVEERILMNRADYEECLIAEEELIDDYLKNELSENERKAFDTHFLSAPERQEELRFARALQTYVNEPVKVRQPVTTRWFQLPSFRFAVPLATAALVLIGIVTWVVFRNSTPPAPVLAVTLNAGPVTRDGGNIQTVKVPNVDGSVQFNLPVSSAPYERYQAVLLSGTGVAIQTSEQLKPADQKLVVLVPTKSLPADDYQFVVNGIDANGGPESFANYRFKVAR